MAFGEVIETGRKEALIEAFRWAGVARAQLRSVRRTTETCRACRSGARGEA